MYVIQDRYAVIGNPIEHSLSPVIHQAFAKQTQQMLTYERLLSSLSPPDQFIVTVRQFMASGGKGLNVTHPFKEQAFALVEQYSKRAARAKAVNTILCQPDGSLYGDNTDGIGLVRDLTINQQYPLRGKHILLLGAGGAVRGVLGPLLDEQPAQITIANRTLEKAQQLAREFPIHACSWDKLDKMSKLSFDIIINGTTVLLRDHFIMHRENGATQFYDMNYINSCDGLGMLVEQAAESFFLWRGIRPNTQQVIREMMGDRT
jgi:shikimate dehydrogenase